MKNNMLRLISGVLIIVITFSSLGWLLYVGVEYIFFKPRSTLKKIPSELAEEMSRFYLNPNLFTAGEFISYLRRNPDLTFNSADNIGTLSELFKRYPSQMDTWLYGHYYLPEVANLIACALYATGELEKAEKFKRSTARWYYKNSGLSPEQINMCNRALTQAIAYSPSHLDMWWSAFFISGDKTYILKIIDSVAAAHKAGISWEALTSGAIAFQHYGPTASRLADIFTRFKEDQKKLQAFSTGFSGLWSLGSNAKQHQKVASIVSQYTDNTQDKQFCRALKSVTLTARCNKTIYDSSVAIFPTTQKAVEKFLSDQTRKSDKNRLDNMHKSIDTTQDIFKLDEPLMVCTKHPYSEVDVQISYLGSDCKLEKIDIDSKLASDSAGMYCCAKPHLKERGLYIITTPGGACTFFYLT